MGYSGNKPFSWGWVFGSFILFILIEMILGGFVGPWVRGRYLSPTLGYALPGFLNLMSYFLCGFLIGAFSTGRRVFEPAVAALAYIGLMYCLTFFHPHSYLAFQFVRSLIGGGIAFALALFGAQMGANSLQKSTF